MIRDPLMKNTAEVSSSDDTENPPDPGNDRSKSEFLRRCSEKLLKLGKLEDVRKIFREAPHDDAKIIAMTKFIVGTGDTALISALVEDIWKKYLLENDKAVITLLFHLAKGRFYSEILKVIKQETEDFKKERDYIRNKLWRLMGDGKQNFFKVMADDTSVFRSGMQLNIWENLIYSYVPITRAELPNIPPEDHPACVLWIWKVAQVLVPCVKRIHDKKLLHHQAVDLVEQISSHVGDSDTITRVLFKEPFLQGIKNGVHEFVDAILKNYRDAIQKFKDGEQRSVFHLAVMYRHEEVFKILCRNLKVWEYRHLQYDIHGNSILHTVAYTASRDKLDLETKGVLQTQRELQWFMEVGKFVEEHNFVTVDEQNSSSCELKIYALKDLLGKVVKDDDTKNKTINDLTSYDLKKKAPQLEELKLTYSELDKFRRVVLFPEGNTEVILEKVSDVIKPEELVEHIRTREEMIFGGKTPLEIFIEEHDKMAKSEKNRMKEMATASMVASALIASAAFGAIISGPGGNDNNGFPILSKEPSFIVFAIASILAFLLALDSIIAFISIYTSRYGYRDFLQTLPNRMIFGLIFLLLAVCTLMIAFSAAVFLVIAKQNVVFLAPIIALASVPVIFCVASQLNPLLNMIKSTYWPVNLTN